MKKLNKEIDWISWDLYYDISIPNLNFHSLLGFILWYPYTKSSNGWVGVRLDDGVDYWASI